MSSKPFILDSDYENFTPGITPLKFTTIEPYNNVYNIPAGCIGIAFFGGSGVFLLGFVLLISTMRDLAQPTPDLERYLPHLFVFGLLSLAFSGYFVWMIRAYFRGQSRYRRLQANGQLLDGVVREVEQKIRSSRYSRYHYLDVTYSFTSPTGYPLTRKVAVYRPDLQNTPRHLVGRPVRVLYADDDAVVIL